MYLKSIELTGFKSFAKKNGFEFNTPISAIVGPNGSGKSNVAEAFRFVLGEQSIKSLRGKRGEDLIWNGSSDTPRSSRASVKLVFDNEHRVFDIDFAEVTIERVVARDGVNEYFINDSAVRLKDVIELLAKAHIGASGHHIISQGEADKIISASARDRKGMVEDALGLKLYQFKRAESERKLDKTFENIGQVESLRKEIAPHLRFLTKQVEKLEKTKSLKEDLLNLAKEFFKREEIYITEARKFLESEYHPLTTSLEKLETELAEAKKTLAEAGEKEKKEYLILELEKELSIARTLKDVSGRELGKVEGLMDAQMGILKKQELLTQSDEHKIIPLKDVEILYREIESEKEDTGILARIKDKFLNFIKDHRESAPSNLLLEVRKSIEELQSERVRVEKKFKEAQEKEKKLQVDYEHLKKDVERTKDGNNAAQIAVFRIMSEENELHSRLNLIKVREEQIHSDDTGFKRELEEISRLVGAEVLQYHVWPTPSVSQEERRVQLERQRSIQKLKIRFEDASMAGSDEILKEYRETSERDEFLGRELLDLERSAESLKNLIKDLELRLITEFKIGLENINKEFGKLFSTVFDGGEAKLILVREKGRTLSTDSQGPTLESGEEEMFEEGLEIQLSLPRKKIKGLMMLSGGERALTSIALIFAISAVNPPPFIILDETDAALDEANSRKYGDMIELLSKYSQLILITHNRETMSRAGVIYGVTMSGNGISKVLSISFDEATDVAK